MFICYSLDRLHQCNLFVHMNYVNMINYHIIINNSSLTMFLKLVDVIYENHDYTHYNHDEDEYDNLFNNITICDEFIDSVTLLAHQIRKLDSIDDYTGLDVDKQEVYINLVSHSDNLRQFNTNCQKIKSLMKHSEHVFYDKLNKDLEDLIVERFVNKKNNSPLNKRKINIFKRKMENNDDEKTESLLKMEKMVKEEKEKKDFEEKMKNIFIETEFQFQIIDGVKKKIIFSHQDNLHVMNTGVIKRIYQLLPKPDMLLLEEINKFSLVFKNSDITMSKKDKIKSKNLNKKLNKIKEKMIDINDYFNSNEDSFGVKYDILNLNKMVDLINEVINL